MDNTESNTQEELADLRSLIVGLYDLMASFAERLTGDSPIVLTERQDDTFGRIDPIPENVHWTPSIRGEMQASSPESSGQTHQQSPSPLVLRRPICALRQRFPQGWGLTGKYPERLQNQGAPIGK